MVNEGLIPIYLYIRRHLQRKSGFERMKPQVGWVG